MSHMLWSNRKIETNAAAKIILMVVTLYTFTGCAGNYGSLRKNGEKRRILRWQKEHEWVDADTVNA